MPRAKYLKTEKQKKAASEYGKKYRARKLQEDPNYIFKTREAQRRHKEKIGAERVSIQLRIRRLRHLYGISVEEYDHRLKIQEDRCAICFSLPDTKHGKLNIDHCHKSGVVRGLLCNKCNTLLGWIEKNSSRLEGSFLYLSRFQPASLPVPTYEHGSGI